jgi:hypothetical protein
MKECGLEKILSLEGFQWMKINDIIEFKAFLHSEKPSLLAGGSYGAAKGFQGYKSATGRVIKNYVQTDSALFYLDMYWMSVSKCKDFDDANGPSLWKSTQCTGKSTFQALLECMENILESVIKLRMICNPKGSVVFMCLGEAVGMHWGPIGERLQRKYPNFVMHCLPCHPCRYSAQPPEIKNKFKLVASEVGQMLRNLLVNCRPYLEIYPLYR